MCDYLEEAIYYGNLLIDDSDDEPPSCSSLSIVQLSFYYLQEIFHYYFIIFLLFIYGLYIYIPQCHIIMPHMTLIYPLSVLYIYKVVRFYKCTNIIIFVYDYLFFFAGLWGFNKSILENIRMRNYAIFFVLSWLIDIPLGGNIVLHTAYDNLIYYHNIITGFFYQIIVIYRESGFPITEEMYAQCTSLIYFIDWFVPAISTFFITSKSQ